MKTKLITDETDLAAELIARGELVAVPTETVYGLAGSGLCAEAVEKIYEVKGRPQIKPLSLMVSDSSAMELYCDDVPDGAKLLADKFWPGPLTVVLKSKSIVPDIVRAGGSTVGLRCPDHEKTLALLRTVKLPLAAPSANPSGEPSPKNAQTVMDYFDGEISAVIDGGECILGTESTIIDMSKTPYAILRHGALSEDEIKNALVCGLKMIGITGGSGAGKTTALNELKSLGALVIDCDALYHEMLNCDEKLGADIKESFPDVFTNGEPDRRKLGKTVFNDAAALKRLNEITHGHIIRRVEELLRDHALNGGTMAAIDAVELIESGLGAKCGILIAVTADAKKRVERITARDGVSEEYAMMRIKAQKPDSYYAENCDIVLENNGTDAEFADKCKNLFKEVLING